MADDDHPVLDAINARGDELAAEQGELIGRLEIVSSELEALGEARAALLRGLIRDVQRERNEEAARKREKKAEPPAEKPKRKAPSGDGPAKRSLKLRENQRANVLGFLEGAAAGDAYPDGWAPPPDIIAGTKIPRTGYQRAIRELADAGQVESRGSRGSLRYRIAGLGSRGVEEPAEDPAPATDPPKPPPAPLPAPRAPKPRQVQPPAPTKPERPPTGRSDGIEKPPTPAGNGHKPFDLTAEHKEVLEAVSGRPLTPEGIAIKLRIGVAAIIPICEALVNARYLQRGKNGDATIYGVGQRVPA